MQHTRFDKKISTTLASDLLKNVKEIAKMPLDPAQNLLKGYKKTEKRERNPIIK